MSGQKKRTVKKDVTKIVEGSSDRMIREVARFLRIQGWNVVVAGPARIQRQPSSAKLNYEFVLPFTGTRNDR